eukprot:jgi/Tetstr1/429262/TSEL_019180.t1
MLAVALLPRPAAAQLAGSYEELDTSSAGRPANDDVLKVLGGGASFPNSVYQDAILAYRFLPEGASVGLGSGAGKCRLKDYEQECGDDKREPRYLDFAASDSLLTEAEYEKYPDLQMLPTLASAVVPVYNLFANNPGSHPPLKLDRITLARVFRGSISSWRDPAILALNPGLRGVMPDQCIQASEGGPGRRPVVARADGSGTTEVFKEALAMFDPVSTEVIGTGPAGGPAGWPSTRVPGLYCGEVLFRNGSSGVAAAVLNMPYAIGYVSLGAANAFDMQKARLLQGPLGSLLTRFGSFYCFPTRLRA